MNRLLACLPTAMLLLTPEAHPREIQVPMEFADIQSAIDASMDGDTVVVAPGTYVVESPIDFRGKAIVLRSSAGPERTIVRMLDLPYASSVFLFENGEGPGSILRGFTITGGKGKDGFGGGVHCSESSPSLIGNVFVENEARKGGGAIYGFNPNGLFLFENAFRDNAALGESWDEKEAGGGAILLVGVGRVRAIPYSPLNDPKYAMILRNVFTGNRAVQSGGAISLVGAVAQIRGNRFIENISHEKGGAMHLFNSSPDSIDDTHTAVSDNLFLRNRAGGGGAISQYADFFLRMEIQDNAFIENEASGTAGAIGLGAGAWHFVTIRRCHFERNRAGGSSGAISMLGGIYTIEDCTFLKNRADRGGAISTGHGRDLLFRNNTVVANEALTSGGGVFLSSAGGDPPRGPLPPWKSRSLFVNNIIWGNKPDDVFTRDAVCDNIWYSILGRTNHESICDSDAISEEQGNLFADPLLADPEKGDLRLLPGSPAIDAGDPTGDLDPDGTRADIGALWFPQSPPFLRGDADEDGRLGLGDAILCLEHLFASKGLACEKAADVDDDGALTIGDVVRLLNFLFAGGEPPTAPYPDPGQDPTADELACTR